MKLTVEKAKVIEAGKHQGIIVAIEYRTEPFAYTDVCIEFEGGVQLKAGYPTYLMEESKLGKLLKRFGVVVSEGLEIDPDVLIGRACEFLTMNQVKQNGTFANIIADSVTPSTNGEVAIAKEEFVSKQPVVETVQ